MQQSENRKLLGYANVYRTEDGLALELGSADIDDLAEVYPYAADWQEHVGIAEIRLLPNTNGKSGSEVLAALSLVEPVDEKPIAYVCEADIRLLADQPGGTDMSIAPRPLPQYGMSSPLYAAPTASIEAGVKYDTSIATVSDHNAAFDPADDAFGGAFKDGFREGWLFAKTPDFEDREELEEDYPHIVDIAPSECWDAYREKYFAMLPLAAIPEVGSSLTPPSEPTPQVVSGMRKSLKMAEDRIALLLREYPDASETCDHPVATRYVLGQVRAALGRYGADDRLTDVAPELLEALQNLAAAVAGGGPVSDEIVAAGYAIAKATTSTPDKGEDQQS